MSSKGSQLSRAVQFFREGNIDETRVALQLVNEVMGKRLDAERQQKIRSGKPYDPFARKTRKRKAKVVEGQATQNAPVAEAATAS